MGYISQGIVKSISVDNITLETNGEGQLQIKDGGVSKSIMSSVVANAIGEVLLDQSISADTSYTLGTGYTRLKVFGSGCGGIHINGKTSGYTGNTALIYENGTSDGGTNTTHFYVGTNNQSTNFFMLDIMLINGRIWCNGQAYAGTGANEKIEWCSSSVAVTDDDINAIELEFATSGKLKVIGYKD
jgi:hypothetical protein